MALLDVLLLVLAMMMARGAWRVIEGVMEGISGRPPRAPDRNVPARGVQMVRDPVCGTYVIPDRAIALSDGTGPVFFCSANCRDKYRARPSSDRRPPVEGRTA
jgi:YHS domain-containing protein